MYLTKYLGYSERPAYDRIQAIRVLKIAPEVSDKLENGTLTLTQLVRVEQSLKQEKKLGHEVTLEKTKELLIKLENRNGFETQKIIAVEMNQAPLQIQIVKPQSDNSIRLELTLTEEQFETLKKAQSLLSHVVVENDLAQVITKLAKVFIQKKDGKNRGSQKTEKSLLDPLKVSSSQKTNASVMRSFRLVPEQISRKVGFLEEKGLHDEKGHLVNLKQKYKRPYMHDEITNLRLLCGVHNRYEALRWGLTRPLQVLNTKPRAI